MRVNEIIKQMDEGVNDPHIFKAVFLAGGPGSGKSFVANKMLEWFSTASMPLTLAPITYSLDT